MKSKLLDFQKAPFQISKPPQGTLLTNAHIVYLQTCPNSGRLQNPFIQRKEVKLIDGVLIKQGYE